MQHKIFLICILFFSLQLHSYACGPYAPSDEDYRFYMLDPSVFVGDAFDGLRYNQLTFTKIQHTENMGNLGHLENLKLWQEYSSATVKLEDIKAVIYGKANLEEANSTNSFVRFLQEQQKSDAIKYIQFARELSPYNSGTSRDYWETDNPDQTSSPRYKYFQTALRMVDEVEDANLKKRYAFLAIRLAFYLAQPKEIQRIYEAYFQNNTKPDILDHWAMYFYGRAAETVEARAYYAALVFNQAADKRFISLRQYKGTDALNKVLAFAKDDSERAAIWLVEGFRRNGPALECLEKVYTLNPQDPGLDDLLFRELSKLEDWLQTPYYVGYSTVETKDQDYAKALLAWANGIDLAEQGNQLAFKVAVAYLNMMLEEHKVAGKALKQAEKLAKGQPAAQRQLALLRFLNDIKNKPLTKVKIPKKYQKLLMETVGTPEVKYYGRWKWVNWKEGSEYNRKIIFAIARELEFSGNTTLSAILFSKISGVNYIHSDKYRSSYEYFYSDYRPYLDIAYSAPQMWDLCDHIRKAKANKGFKQWFYAEVKREIHHLEDITGSKYIRKNQLDSALLAFEMVHDSIWQQRHYQYCLDGNPFYANLYKEHSIYASFDTIRYTKASLTRKLIDYLKLAEDESNEDRDYYYLLVGNCYFNMTYYGNSWIMRRAGWSTYKIPYGLSDDSEFYECHLAKKYYKKAAETAQNKDFQLACWAMAARMEHYALLHKNEHKKPDRFRWGVDGELPEYRRFMDSLEQQNPYIQKARALNATNYQDLRGSCYAFDDYLKAREAL